jgi:hypothetical protein
MIPIYTLYTTDTQLVNTILTENTLTVSDTSWGVSDLTASGTGVVMPETAATRDIFSSQ